MRLPVTTLRVRHFIKNIPFADIYLVKITRTM